MNQIWLLYTFITLAYIVILIVYFIRRSKRHEIELSNFLDTARAELEQHKQKASIVANAKVAKMANVVKNIQESVDKFEEEAKIEYDQIIEDAKNERRQILSDAKSEIETLFTQAENDLRQYRTTREKEIETSLVKLVIAVTEKVVETSLNEKQHKDLIFKALDQVKQNKQRL